MSNENTAYDRYALLSNRRRRTIIRILSGEEVVLSVDELVDRIADHEFENPSNEDRRAIRLTLYHNHLPRLVDGDVVTFDTDTEIVRLRSGSVTLVHALDPWTDRDVARSRS